MDRLDNMLLKSKSYTRVPTVPRRGTARLLLLTFLVAAIGTALVSWVLVTMFTRKQEARNPYVRIVELSEISVDPEPWGLNWPHHFEGWKSTAGDKFYGGSSALPQSNSSRSRG
jgi:nitrite reductase (cytochrome c-552)